MYMWNAMRKVFDYTTLRAHWAAQGNNSAARCGLGCTLPALEKATYSTCWLLRYQKSSVFDSGSLLWCRKRAVHSRMCNWVIYGSRGYLFIQSYILQSDWPHMQKFTILKAIHAVVGWILFVRLEAATSKGKWSKLILYASNVGAPIRMLHASNITHLIIVTKGGWSRKLN